jgi:CheY-like chemotaxis protein
MVVEDEVSVLKVVTLLLQQLGCTVHPFEGGAEAVKFFETSSDKVGLVLLDMRMPGMDGRATFEALRRIDPEVKVLIASGYSVEGDARDLLNRGAHGFLQKPYRKKHLAEELKRLLGLPGKDSDPLRIDAAPV